MHCSAKQNEVLPYCVSAILCRVVWVLKELEPENWVHNGGTDFAVQLKPPSAADVLGKVLTAEGTYTHWSLFNRFILANEILDAADSAGIEYHPDSVAHHAAKCLRQSQLQGHDGLL